MISPDFTNSDRAHLVRFVRRFVNNPDTAEDIAQDALLRAHKFEHRGEAAFTSWLYKIAHNLCIDHYRRVKPECQLFTDAHFNEDSGRIDEYEAHLIDPRPSAQQNIERCAMHEQIQRAIADLSPIHREAIHAFYYEGQSLKEMAENFHCGLSGVKMRLFHAKRALRKRLMN